MAHARTLARADTAIGRFAHLLGIPAGKKGGHAEDEDRRPEDEEDADAASAETETDDGEEVEEDEKKDGKKGKKAKKAKAADDDDPECEDEECEDEGDEEMAKATRAGALAERARCRTIFASEAAGLRPDLAAHLAFTTDMDAKAAVSLLQTAAGGAPRARPGAREPRPRVDLGDGGGAAPTGAKAVAAQILAAGRKARGEAA